MLGLTLSREQCRQNRAMILARRSRREGRDVEGFYLAGERSIREGRDVEKFYLPGDERVAHGSVGEAKASVASFLLAGPRPWLIHFQRA